MSDTDEQVLPLAHEELGVTKQLVEEGRVRVRRSTRRRTKTVTAPLVRQVVEVTRRKLGRYVDAMPPIRREGDTLVIPLVEERAEVVRRLFVTEEIRVRRVARKELRRATLTLRHQEAVVDRSSAGPSRAAGKHPSRTHSPAPHHRSDSMKYHTIAAAYDNRDHAQSAMNALKAAGFHPADISLLDRKTAPESSLWNTKSPTLWQRIFGASVMEHEARIYDKTVGQGGAIIAVRVPDNEVAHATGILDLHHPIDVQDRALTTGVMPAARVEAAAARAVAAPLTAKQEVALPAKLAGEQVLRLAEEQLNVGKRMLETGRTRVRRFVTERDVSADVTLHEEHAEVMRRAVADPKFLADVDWADKEIEVVETAEQALVNKTAKVVEEVALKSVGSDHVQTLHEKIRHQEVEVEKLDAEGKKIPAYKRAEPERATRH